MIEGIERVYHPYNLWEDYEMGLYEVTCFMDAQRMVEDCEMTLRCPEMLWEAMTFVSHNWGYASEQHLTNSHRNRQAWLGQAACCWLHGAPEYLVKQAWNNLNAEMQKKANEVADDVINDWENKYRKKYFEWQK